MAINPYRGLRNNNSSDYGILAVILPDEDYRWATRKASKAECKNVHTNTLRFVLPKSPSMATAHEKQVYVKCFSRFLASTGRWERYTIDELNDSWVMPYYMANESHRFPAQDGYRIRYTN